MKHLDLTRDINALVGFITGVGPTGGGDAPEAYELGLQVTRGLSWEAVWSQSSFDLLTHFQEPGNRALVMIGDSFPHPPSYTTQSIWWRDELQALVDMGIKVRVALLLRYGALIFVRYTASSATPRYPRATSTKRWQRCPAVATYHCRRPRASRTCSSLCATVR